MSPEKIEQAIRLLHSGGMNTLDALKSLTEMIDLQQQQINILTDKVESLEAGRRIAEEKAHQEMLNELDRQDGQWYREANGLG